MPIDGQLVQQILRRLQSREEIESDSFAVAADICRAVSMDSESVEAHSLIFRALEQRDAFGEAVVILDGLTRKIGLFPYLEPSTLSLPDLLAYEAHRPFGMDDRLVFHRAQAHVYHLLREGKNVALSAPTSFGKSLLIDAAIASGNYKNIVIVVPTLALIDETRRRLAGRFKREFKVITRSSQKPSERNIFVLTQERVLDRPDWSGIDFFVIDEFYKLAPKGKDDNRCAILNQAFYMLAKTGAQFYMLGPDIKGITDQNHLRLELQFVHEPHFHTVATEVHRVSPAEDNFESLIALCRTLKDPTIIFCRSPARVSDVARRLVEAGITAANSRMQAAAKWVGSTFHEEWHFTKALSQGIGIHHARVPRSLAQFVARCFNDGNMRFLACTSTLIEGVNTRARNIIVFDNTINKEQIDLFTFNNIKGRSGRMFQYFVGHVYVFHNDPETDLLFVDVPAMSQSDDAADSMIVQMDEADLTDRSKERLEVYKNQDVLSYDVIKSNKGIDPALQMRLASRIAGESDDFKDKLVWSGSPRGPQLLQICELMFDECNGVKLGNASARKPRQLVAMIRALQDRPSIRELIEKQIQYSSSEDEGVGRALDFLRLWADFHFPRLLRTINRIQADVLSREGRRYGNYEWFASQVESQFHDPTIAAMEEFGIPVTVARKLGRAVQTDGDLDEAFQRIRALQLDRQRLSRFERELVEDARAHM